MLLIQVHEVIGLQQHIGKLGIGNPVRFQTTLDGIAIQHCVQGKVFPDITQELDNRHPHRPISVIDQGGGIVAGKVNELAQLLFNSSDIRF